VLRRERGREFYRRLVERNQDDTGHSVGDTGAALALTDGGIAFANVAIDGTRRLRTKNALYYETVGPQYFQTMRIPFVHGRDFDERDQEGAPGVVIVNETMARRYWPGGDALGRRNQTDQGLAGNRWHRQGCEISQLERSAPGHFSTCLTPGLSLEHDFGRAHDYRTGKISQSVRAEVAALDPGIPIFDFKTLEEHVGISLFYSAWQQRS